MQVIEPKKIHIIIYPRNDESVRVENSSSEKSVVENIDPAHNSEIFVFRLQGWVSFVDLQTTTSIRKMMFEYDSISCTPTCWTSESPMIALRLFKGEGKYSRMNSNTVDSL